MPANHLQHDHTALRDLLLQTLDLAYDYLSGIAERPSAALHEPAETLPLPDEGLGAAAALVRFAERYAPHMAANNGGRYLGFVTGGTTPAAIMGDWLVSAYDTNVANNGTSVAPYLERETIRLLCSLFGLPDAFSGVFVTGATISNMVGLALGREWAAQQQGRNVTANGLYGMTPTSVISGEPHSSIFKALSMLGMGRSSVIRAAQQPEREAVVVEDIRVRLAALNGTPAIVVANGGTVNTVDFDDIKGIAALKTEFPFWLHVDAAFGGFAACSPHYASRLEGWELADSITVDAHKWLNVPYDAAMIFTPHRDLQLQVFQNSAAYLGEISDPPDFFHLTPENSRRFRALPAWFTLMAYGRAGYQRIVEENCAAATSLAAEIERSDGFRLLAPARMNVVCFTLADTAGAPTKAVVGAFLGRLAAGGRAFLTPTTYQGIAGMRAAFSNWRTTLSDVAIVWEALQRSLRDVSE
ncbi:MAG TPA: pyridoxal-dependent decarboxylase [Aggregatilineales bacterium]|nr:aspartate aminotransferase family protein [Anaerolineales bacterium]HRE49380.1 pyridoxal-dependent decarboxylase [Aggregatilineales bacterium]